MKITLHPKNKNQFIFSNLIVAKVYLGFSKSIWDPRILPYLLGVRDHFCIFDLDQTTRMIKKSVKLISKISSSKGRILFVGFPETEKLKLIKLCTLKNHSYISDQSWINGVLTNGPNLFFYKKKFLSNFNLKNEKEKWLFYEKFGGILNLNKKPDLLVIYNHSQSLEALHEATKMDIPTISFINSTNSPEKVDYPITGNFMSKNGGKIYYNLIKYLLN
jgi:small subunit ribosomal protein S2